MKKGVSLTEDLVSTLVMVFLIKEILSLTGISIQETGIPGFGVRFEILVPKPEAESVR